MKDLSAEKHIEGKHESASAPKDEEIIPSEEEIGHITEKTDEMGQPTVSPIQQGEGKQDEENQTVTQGDEKKKENEKDAGHQIVIEGQTTSDQPTESEVKIKGSP